MIKLKLLINNGKINKRDALNTFRFDEVIDGLFQNLSQELILKQVTKRTTDFLKNINIFKKNKNGKHIELTEIRNKDYLVASLGWLFVGLPIYTFVLPIRLAFAATNLAIGIVINTMMFTPRLTYGLLSLSSTTVTKNTLFFDDNDSALLIEYNKKVAKYNLYNAFIYPIEHILNSVAMASNAIIDFIAAIGFTIATPTVGIARAILFSFNYFSDNNNNSNDRKDDEELVEDNKVEIDSIHNKAYTPLLKIEKGTSIYSTIKTEVFDKKNYSALKFII